MTRNGSSRRRRSARLAVLVPVIVSASVVAGAGSQVVSAAPTACGPNDRFGRLIGGLTPATHDATRLTRLANVVTETSHVEPGDESDIDAGYTYVGQFIDHDIVLDPRPSDLLSIVDVNTLRNNRTPSLDLDSVYGNGPTGSPQLYDTDGFSLKLGAPLTGAQSDPGARDVLRDPVSGRAIIGDARNDENRVTASLHSLFTRFHNRVARDLKIANPTWTAQQVFTSARDQVRWHYQWAVLTDFLPTMSSASELAKSIRWDGTRWVPSLRYYNACNGSMPVEFSVAGYRWHTMVRNDYQLNDAIKDLPVFDGTANPRTNLAGFTPSPTDFGIDWNFFFSGGNRTAQKAYKLDNSLVPALGKLPGPSIDGNSTINLSERNLLRGRQLQLPSGQTLARAVGLTPLRDDQILIGPALGLFAPTQSITSVSSNFYKNSPLWTYLFAESVNQKYTVFSGKIWAGSSPSLRLGPLGATIVNDTFAGLLTTDPQSVVNNPTFRPSAAYSGANGQFGFRQIIATATAPMPALPPTTPAPPPPTAPTQACPAGTGWTVAFYPNAELTGDPSRCRSDGSATYNWGATRPTASVGVDNWSMRSTKSVALAAGTRTVTVVADDGVRVWVGNTKLIDDWKSSAVRTITRTIPVAAGNQVITIEYKDVSGDAQLSLTIS